MCIMDKKLIIISAAVIMISLAIMAINSQLDCALPTISIAFAGDTMIGRSVNEFLSRMPVPNKYSYPWGNIFTLLVNNDLNIINLETTITLHTQAVPKVFNFKTDPEHVKALQAANIHVANIANNHILDFGIIGMRDTIAHLDQAGIAHTGAGENIQEAQRPVIITKKGITIGIIGLTDNEPTWQAGAENPGTFYVTVGDIEQVRPVIEQLRGGVDLIIVSIHWGPNWRERPVHEFIEFAHQLIDSGVDIIHGHSAHILQGVEVYHNGLIMYDTGDFVDDYAVDEQLRNDLSCLFVVTADKEGVRSLKLIPTQIKNMQVNYAQSPEKERVLARMRMLSQELGTTIANDTIAIRCTKQH